MNFKLKKCKNLRGKIKIPPDKSITHRALIVGALAKGQTIIKEFSGARDCISTIKVLRNSGVKIEKRKDELIVYGKGFNKISPPFYALDCENSGTTIRLMSGVFSSIPYVVTLTGDLSLRNRPMKRIIEPLTKMGATIKGRGEKGFPPLVIEGKELKPIEYNLKIPSAQVKSSIILAALNTEGKTKVKGKINSRDHTERMLEFFEADIFKRDGFIEIYGKKELKGREIKVPGDISSASFFIALSVLIENSEILLEETGVNDTRMGFIKILKKMGAKIEIINRKIVSNEPVADILVRGGSKLKGIEINREEIPFVIDELPLLAVIGTQAKGITKVRGAEELRVKESDRIKSIVVGLRNLGANIEETEDGFIVEGKESLKGGNCESFGDHRIAMSLIVAGLISEGKTEVKNTECIDISFPFFGNYLKKLNCDGIVHT